MAKFVIIDDAPDVLSVNQLALEMEGHEVRAFTSSLQALASIQDEPPDCVVTDLMMPEVDGIELCRRLRAQERFRKLCIVVLSGKIYAADRQRTLDAGASGFIPKVGGDPTLMLRTVIGLLHHSFNLTFWGCRGTMPVPGPGTLRYGGNTACVSMVFPDHHLFVFDAGTGIQRLSQAVLKGPPRCQGTIFLSHPHWDHVNYLPFFTPFFVPGNEFVVVGAPHDRISVQQLVANQMDGVHFPITPQEFNAHVSYRDIGEGSYTFGPAQVDTMLLCHPGYCLGYRVRYGEKTVCYVTDNELFPEGTDSYAPTYQSNLRKFVENADILITDVTYTDEEYPKKMGWGHSSVTPVARLASLAGVKTLYLFHHAPEHDDEDIERMVSRAGEVCRELGNTQCKAALAEEVLELQSP